MADAIYHIPSFIFPHLTGVALPAFIAIPGSPGDIVVHGVTGLAAGIDSVLKCLDRFAER